MKSKQPTYHTKVGKYQIPVYGAEKPTLLAFLDGKCGKNGVYAFWTAEFKKADKSGKRKLWGRAKIGLPAGDRFDRMSIEQHAKSISADDQRIYAYWWKLMGQGANVKLIRPSSDIEIYRWLQTHTHKVFGRFKPVRMVDD